VNRRSYSDSPQWPKLIGTAAAASLATLFVVRNFFPAEKKVRHPIRADYAVGDDTFVRTMEHLLGPPLEKGNKITPLENGDQIFPAMLNGIRSAQRTITFENFLFREGEVSDVSRHVSARGGFLFHASKTRHCLKSPWCWCLWITLPAPS
jgi:hypothetical protein